jgi:hypothetical protein
MPRSLVLSAALLAGTAHAQTAGGPPGPWRFDVAATAVHQFTADVDDGGDVAIDRVFAQASVGYGFDRRTSIGLALGGGFTDFDFGSGATLGGGNPWGRIDELRVSLPIRFGVGEKIDALVIPTLRWNAEDGASFDDGRTEGVLAGATYRFTPNFAVGPGIGVFSALDEDVTVFPILVLDWNVTERLNIGTGGGFGATQGPGLEATYRFDGGFSVALGFRYESVQFRLNEDAPARNGIGEFETVPIYLLATYAPSPNASITAIAGLDVRGEATLMDEDGREIESRTVDPAPFLGLSGRLRF